MHSGAGRDKNVATELSTPLPPRLLALEGPLKDSTITLPEGEIPLGRDPTNAVPLNDLSVSRKHCLFRREEERCQVRDVESRNGTVVNGTAVKEQWLRHGDEIVVGDSVVLFLLEDDERVLPVSRVEFDDGARTADTEVIHPKEGVYLQPDRLPRQFPATSQISRYLK